MTKKVIVVLADGFEDVEAITPVDYLRRAGIEVTTASINSNLVVASRWGDIRLIADTSLLKLTELDENYSNQFDAVILPGGIPGAENLAASKETVKLLKEMAANNKLICAICASPVLALSPLGLLEGKNFTCYPGMKEKKASGTCLDDNVVVDGNIITSRAAGTAGLFSIAIIEKLLDEAAGKKIAETVLLTDKPLDLCVV